jgi:hypothetical protein
MTAMQDWIRFWFRRNDREFDEETKREREQDQALTDLPPRVVEMFARLRGEHYERNQFPVGAFFDSIDKRRHRGQKASVEKLLVVAAAGQELLYEAICTARG